MLIIIFSNDEQYSYTYNDNKTIKEILDDFCSKKGLSSNIYEAFHPTKFHALDTTKNLHYYGLDSIHIRRVGERHNSTQDCLDNLSNEDIYERLWNSQAIRTCSQSSYSTPRYNDPIPEKKNKKGIMFKLKHKLMVKKLTLDRSRSESTVSQFENSKKISISDQVFRDSFENSVEKSPEPKFIAYKKKSKAPLPPGLKDFVTFHFDNTIESKIKTIDLEIPLPPLSQSDLHFIIDNYPWHCNVECFTGDDDVCNESVYSNFSEEPFPVSVSEQSNIETPIFRSPISPIDCREESPDHLYAKINKVNISVNNEDSDHSSIDTPRSSFKTQQVRNERKFKDQHFFHKIKENYISSNNSDSQKSNNITHLNGPILLSESDCSSLCSTDVIDSLYPVNGHFSTNSVLVSNAQCKVSVHESSADSVSFNQESNDNSSVKQGPTTTYC